MVRGSSVSDGGRGASRPPGKVNVDTGPPLADILIYSILLVFSRLLFFAFFGCFRFLASIGIHDVLIHYYFLSFF